MSGIEVIAAFGALSSFLQVVDFSSQVAVQAHELITSGQDALRENIEAERLAQEYEWLGTVTQNLANDPNCTASELVVARLGQQCQLEARKLLSRLEDLRISATTQGVKRLTQGTRQVARAVRQRKAIENHRKYLQELNGQLSTSLLQAFWSQQVRNRSDSTVDTACKLAQSKAKHDSIVTDRILRSLKFSDMTSRWRHIQKAYPETYQWVLRDDAFQFRSWLCSGNGIFWISGQAGSGKSTLLKYLHGAEDTRTLLEKWSSGGELILCGFYFWYLGSKFQKTTEGLLRTILYQIFAERRSLTQVAFPHLFHDRAPINIDDLIDWTFEDLASGLDAVAKHESGAKSIKFCLFIDGLDEYHGNHIELISLLKTLAQNSDFKICVSSRPWNAFRDAFESTTPNLKLEELSYPDICLYINGSIRDAVSRKQNVDEDEDEESVDRLESEINALTEDIATKSEGVFLWVYLVVISVQAGLAEGDSIWMLRRRVEDFPSDLERFFRQILGRVDGVYKEHTAQALKLAFLQADHRNGVTPDQWSWVDFWLMSRYSRGLEDAKFVYGVKAEEKSPKAWKKMHAETRSFLSASCKDLLRLPRMAVPINAGKVTFLHRTVYEFLEAEQMQLEIDQRVPVHFKDGRILHLLALARRKLMNAEPDALLHILETLNESAKSSVLAWHQDLNEEYAAHFEEVVLKHKELCERESSPLPLPAQDGARSEAFFLVPCALATFAAFKSHEYVIALLQEHSACGRTSLFCNSFAPEPVMKATIGNSLINPFGIEKIHIPLLEAVLNFDDVFRTYGGNCAPNIWHQFLRKWALTDLLSNNQIALRHVWEVSKVFLAGGARLNDEFCIAEHARFDSNLTHNMCFAETFLKDRIPADWLGEAENLVVAND